MDEEGGGRGDRRDSSEGQLLGVCLLGVRKDENPGRHLQEDQC